MTVAPKILLADHLKTLKLPTFLREYDRLARQCAAEGEDHVQFLARLVELELIDRERRMIELRIKAARFPAAKRMDSFDFRAIPSSTRCKCWSLPIVIGLTGARMSSPSARAARARPTLPSDSGWRPARRG